MAGPGWGAVAALQSCTSLLLGDFLSLSPPISYSSGSRAWLGPTGLSHPGDALTAPSRGEPASCTRHRAGFLHRAQSLELAHSPAQHGVLALPAEAFVGAAASHGPRTGPGSHREGNGTRILQWPGMLLFHRAAKDLVQPAPEAPAIRTCQNRGDVRDITFPYNSRFFT